MLKKWLVKLIKVLKKLLWLIGGDTNVAVTPLEPPPVSDKPAAAPAPAPDVKPVPTAPVESGDHEDPSTDFTNPSILACLWKPKADHRPDAVVVCWSDNISYKDIRCLVTDVDGKVIFDGGVYSYYERGENKHGKYGGINFDIGRTARSIKPGAKISFYLKGDKARKIPIHTGHLELELKKPRQRLEVNYKSNTNYSG